MNKELLRRKAEKVWVVQKRKGEEEGMRRMEKG